MKKIWLSVLTLCFSVVNSTLGDTGGQTLLEPFKYSPYPLEPDLAQTFFDINESGRRGHNSPRGGLLWEDSTYSDNRVLISIPSNFMGSRNPTIVVFLHGNQATLERDVMARQQVVEQIAKADINAILLAPQLAVDALDSNSGNFAKKNYFSNFIKEAAKKISVAEQNKHLDYRLKHAPIILVAYSGGYLTAAHILDHGGVSRRIKGVILLDALYGQEDTFNTWLRKHHRQSFFVSTYTEPARKGNENVQVFLEKKCIRYDSEIPNTLTKNKIAFFALNSELEHKDLLTHAWVDYPLEDLLRRTKMKH